MEYRIASLTVGYKSSNSRSSENAFMKSTIRGVLFTVAVATLGAGAVGTACAQSAPAAPASSAPQQAHHRGHFRHFGGSPFLGTLLRATRQLSGQFVLTSAQQAQIKTL